MVMRCASPPESPAAALASFRSRSLTAFSSVCSRASSRGNHIVGPRVEERSDALELVEPRPCVVERP